MEYIKEEIKKEIKKSFKQMKMETQHTKIMGSSKKK
jgi:hypothetical protein